MLMQGWQWVAGSGGNGRLSNNQGAARKRGPTWQEQVGLVKGVGGGRAGHIICAVVVWPLACCCCSLEGITPWLGKYWSRVLGNHTIRQGIGRIGVVQ